MSGAVETHPSAVSGEGLRRLCTAIFRAGGSDAAEAALVAEHLVEGNLAGHDSHGVAIVPNYARNLKAGKLVPNTPARLVVDNGALLSFAGDLGFGQRVASEAMAAAIERSGETGVVLVAMHGAHHIGRVGAYGEQAVATGRACVLFVNTVDNDPTVVPAGGIEARFDTNPICIGLPPGERTEPVVLDMATSGIAFGKVHVAHNRGVEVPPHRLIDADGNATTDPGVMFAEPRGALLPFGEHKGYGLALACELLAGALTGGPTIQPGNPRNHGVINNLLGFVFDPARLRDLGGLRREIDAVVDYARSSRPADPGSPVLVAGEPERIAREQRARDGVPMDANTWRELLDAAELVGVERAEAARLAG